MGFLRWMSENGSDWRVLLGVTMVVAAMFMLILRAAFSEFRSAVRPRSHARRWYGIQTGQESAGRILARLAAERRPAAEPAGVPLANWLDAPTWPQPRVSA